MINLGIYCPNWLLARHNTDYQVVQMLGRLTEFSEVKTHYVASRSYTMTFNLDKLLQRIHTPARFLQHGIAGDNAYLDLIYHYGAPAMPDLFFETVKPHPVFMTSGFMTDRFVREVFGKRVDRQEEADNIARVADRAEMVHFHTRGGMERFLYYRPDFREKTASIPFFLPALTSKDVSEKAKAGTDIHILFVGSDGIRKGLPKLIDALDMLGSWYLNIHRVAITIVSKDKPRPKSSYKLKWFSKLPHRQVLDLMQCASIFVLVPDNESYGLVLIEAMNAGCAIITDDDEPRNEIIGDAGIQLSSRSAASIARTLKLLIEDAELRGNLGKKAAKRAADRFHPQVVAAEYETCFRNLLSKANYQL